MPDPSTDSRSEAPPQASRSAGPITVRALLIGLALLPLQGYISIYGFLFNESHPATVSLYYNAVVTLLVLVAVTRLLRRFWPRAALSPGELAVVYFMQTLATALMGHDQMHTLVPIIASPVWDATPENKWASLFGGLLKSWATPTNHNVLWAYHDAHMPILDTPYWSGWVLPMLFWSAFIFVMTSTMLCINVLFRRNWQDESKLSFPIIQLPLDMVSRHGRLYRSRLTWLGFAVAALIDTMNGLHGLFPQVPSIMASYYDLSAQLHTMPWHAIGWTPLNVFPFAVGLAYFIPLELAFSCWFFYVWWKMVRIGSAALGWGRLPRAPWVYEQSFGAYTALAIYSLYSGRATLRRAWRALLGAKIDDAHEPLRYNLALAGVIVGFVTVTGFMMALGSTLVGAASWLVLYLAISLAIARIRAELGSPVHDLHFAGPEVILVEALTPAALGKGTLVTYTFLYAFTHANRSHPMPVQSEALKMASETGVSQRGMVGVLALTAAVAAPLGFFLMVDASARYSNMPTWPNFEAYDRLASWLTTRTPVNWYGLASTAIGLGFTIFLGAMRQHFLWWPFHPAGYAVSGTWSMQLFGPSVFVSWLAKAMVLRYGGGTAYRPASRFFGGLILGEFVSGTFWCLYGNITHKPMFNFLP